MPGSGRQPPHTRSALAASPIQHPPQRRHQLLFDCCVPQLKGGHHSGGEAPHSSLYFSIFCFQLAAPNEGQRPPHTFRPSRALYPKPLPTSKPSYICLLFIYIARRPPKAKAPPSLYLSLEVTNPPQTSKPTTAGATPTARGLRLAMGSGDATIWWRR
jgi:hypothetical protein